MQWQPESEKGFQACLPSCTFSFPLPSLRLSLSRSSRKQYFLAVHGNPAALLEPLAKPTTPEDLLLGEMEFQSREYRSCFAATVPSRCGMVSYSATERHVVRSWHSIWHSGSARRSEREDCSSAWSRSHDFHTCRSICLSIDLPYRLSTHIYVSSSSYYWQIDR